MWAKGFILSLYNVYINEYFSVGISVKFHTTTVKGFVVINTGKCVPLYKHMNREIIAVCYTTHTDHSVSFLKLTAII